MPKSRFALLFALAFVACDSPMSPAARTLRAPEFRGDFVTTKTNVFFDTDASFDNTCNGDVVNLQGKLHQVFTTINYGDSLSITVHSNYADMKGFGVPSGARYVLNVTQTERAFVVEHPDFIFEDTVRVTLEEVSKGSEPNLILHYTQVVSIVNNEFTVSTPKFSSECRG
jgi:hypothetical protein